MNKINKKKIIIILLTIFIITSIIFGVLISTENKTYTNAQESTNSKLIKRCKEMTQSSVFKVNNQRYDNTNYADYLVDRFQLNNKIYDVKGITDEWILQIVPVELFRQKREFFYIGNAYGFYFNYNSTTQKYLIYLIRNELQYNDGLLVRTIKPIYYEQYVFNEETETVSLPYMDYYVNLKPFKVHYYHYQKYSDYEKLYLKDVNFTGSLYNENHLNIGENDYEPYQDNGGYFVESRYQFNGVSTQSGKTEFAGAELQIGIGYIPLQTRGLTLGNVLKADTIITELSKFAKYAVNDIHGKVSNEDRYYQKQFLGMTRDNQISNYGKPLKNSATKFHTNNTKEAVLLGINSDNYARSEYLINFYDQENMWNTRYVGNVSLDIVKEVDSFNGSKVEEIANDIQAVTDFSYTIDNGEKTDINLDETKQIYVLKDTKHKISFMAPVNGRFTISTIGDVANDIDINQSEILSKESCGVNKKVVFYLRRNEVIELDIFKSIINSANILNVKVEFTPEEIEKGQTKTLTIEAGDKEYYTFNADFIGFSYIFNLIENIELTVSQTTYYNTIYSHTGNEIFGSVVKNTGKYYIAIKKNTSSPQTVEFTINDVEELDIDVVNQVNVMYQNAFSIELPYTMDVNLTVDYESSMFIEIYNNESGLIKRTTDASNNILNFKILANQTYFIVVKNLLNATEQVAISFDKLISTLLPTFNYFNMVYEDGILLFNNQNHSGEYYVLSEVDFLVYDNQFNLLEANNEGSYIFIKDTNYYLVTKETKETCNINFNIKHTTSLSGIFTTSEVVFIKYIPLESGQYNISGIDSYTWYSDDLNIRYGDLTANRIYYLMIEAEANTSYEIGITYQEIIRTQIPILVGVERITGNYYFTIVQNGNYTFKTFRNSDSVNSTISVYSPDGTEYFSDICTDITSRTQYLTAGTYYLDLETTPTTETVSIRITKLDKRRITT